ncbi:MAG: CRISPR-associated helicase Cas3' [Clostridia bacterium]
MIYARKKEKQFQTLFTHSMHVSQLAAEGCTRLHALMRLCGLLHDLGKATKAFQHYLLMDGQCEKVEHAIYGAAYAKKRWHGTDAYRMLTAELVYNAVAGHHARLPDALNPAGDPYLRPDMPLDDLPEALENFFGSVAAEAELDAQFDLAVEEVRTMCTEIQQACADLPSKQQNAARMNLMGLLQREVHSRLIDADRWDAYCFEAGIEPASTAVKPWKAWQERLEKQLDSFAMDSAIAKERAKVADECLHAARQGDAGVYRLCVPTGGGKTLSVMRFALEMAQRNQKQRIVYAAPFKAILEQTADVLRGVFQDSSLILEHHSDVIVDTEEDNARYALLTQRWDTPLILTTMVQLLNTLFLGRGASARRFGALRGAVLILDEVQSIPMHCWYPLNLALRYLASCADCTVVLCTATQPLLEKAERFPLCKPKHMIADESALYEAFCRVRVVDRTQHEMEPAVLAREVSQATLQCSSALCIVNTKATALALYRAFQSVLAPAVPLYCLTTALCPAHRLQMLREIRALLQQHKPVVCVATQLVEAGVDISFGMVTRSLCSLASIAQAAGRCNRHGEMPMAELWLVRLAGESLLYLQDIADEQKRTQAVLDAVKRQPERFRNDLLSPEAMALYFTKTMLECEPKMSGLLKGGGTLLELLSFNDTARIEYKRLHGQNCPTILAQAFRTAGNEFCALQSDTISVLTPYGRGEALIEALAQATDLAAVARLTRQAQPYAVGIYPYQLQKLKEYHALRELPYGLAVDKPWYDEQVGLTNHQQQMELYAL